MSIAGTLRRQEHKDAAALPRSTRTAKPVRAKSRWLVLAVMSVAAVYFLLPVWWLLVSATKTNSALTTTNGFWFGDFALADNIRALFGQEGGIYARWLLNTAVYAVGGAAVSTLISSLAGYALAKYAFRGREFSFNVVLAAVLVPQPLLAIPLYLMFSQVHLVNTYWAVLLPSMVSPFGVYLARIYAAASVPDEVIEAGRVDGAGEFRIFATIGMRIMTPALVTIFLFQFVAIWTNYLLPVLMLADDKLQPVTVGIVGWQSQQGIGTSVPYNIIITAALVSVIPLVLLFLTLQRFWRSGLTTGSVK
ncbi:carbohydrate ABC transporter permease [Streptomyces sp. NBC_01020]|uniref:carbohydrate ABC transporter permease n=1 Tax=unclassified Streptomyces TaxID=2593676 RepID=UPI002E1E4DA1|nr:carbohydrate ABC transporter permease [Streptomyces sp. NBC_01020]WSX46119.1 carbohydrate ABC transporter permease [Streptomyces sp. NBC_00963]WSX65810.1 carbohydrate ABC transporter permease [Streptomyces sp. NBC_00932]